MTAAIDIIKGAMRRIGALGSGEEPTADEAMDSLEVLNELLEQWSLDALMVYRRDEIVIPLNGKSSYLIGPSDDADINTARPNNIISAFVRSDGSDFPVDVVGDDTFNAIYTKETQAQPRYLRFDAAVPVARIDVWPVSDSYELHIICDYPFSTIESPADELILPTGYKAALRLNLALALCGEFQRAVPDDLNALAIASKAAVMRNNRQDDTARFDAAISYPSISGIAGFKSGW